MRYIILFILISLFTQQGFAQKIKYKDLFVLLKAKRYEEAEPFLRAYLADDKNKDEANPQLQMGNIYHEKALKADILDENKHAILYIDSAVSAYNTSLSLLDDKEIRKNDDFYQDYLRRDLRTGKVEIKLSDIHFDLKKRVEDLQNRQKIVIKLKSTFDEFTGYYEEVRTKALSLFQEYPDKKSLYLRGETKVVSSLKEIYQLYDSAKTNFRIYEAILKDNPGLANTPQWREVKLLDFKDDVDLDVDFRSSEIKTYDLGKWASETLDLIEKDIQPLKKHLIDYDKTLEALHTKLNQDSTSIHSDLTGLTEKLLARQLEKFDTVAMPLHIFRLKLEELEYLSSLLEYSNLKDSANIHLHLQAATSLMGKASNVESLAAKAESIDIETEAQYYSIYIKERYGSAEKVKSMINEKMSFISNEKKRLQEELDLLEKSLKYMVYKNDSIPLIPGEEIDSLEMYYPIETIEEKYSTGFFVPSRKLLGVYITDINPSRRSQMKVDMALDTLKFKTKNLLQTEVMSTTDVEEQIFYIVVTQPSVKDSTLYNSVVGKIYKSEGLAWSKPFSWKSKPSELFYQPDTGDLVVSFEKIDEKPAIIDNNGEARNN